MSNYNNKIKRNNYKNQWTLATFFLSFFQQQLGKIHSVLNRLVFQVGFSKGSKKTNVFTRINNFLFFIYFFTQQKEKNACNLFKDVV